MLESQAMPPDAVVGFWSYAHDDNRLDGGAILELARLIAEEYDLLSGEPLELFIDESSVTWGDKWRERIDSALSQTTFFIPIITPRYFTRPECRRELLEFAGKAKSLGVDELLLPILYVEVEDFSTESLDEAVALVANTQYEDWRNTRLLEPSSREYRSAVNTLAKRLLKIAKEVSQKQLDREVDSTREDGNADGVMDIVEEISQLLPEWLDAVQGEKVNQAQMDATVHQLLDPIYRLRKSHAPASAVLSAQIRFAREMLPLAERRQKDAQIYLARSIELDPLVSALPRLVLDHPESRPLIAPVTDAVEEAMAVIRADEDFSSRPGAHTIASHFEEMRHLGRIFQRCYAILSDSSRASQGGNDIVKRWDTELRNGQGDI
jgi:TIR domain